MELSKSQRSVGKVKMSFSVRFNAEDEEVEGLCTSATELQSTESTDEQLKTPEQFFGNSQYIGLFGLKRSSSLDAESSPCDTIRRLDSFLSDIKEGLWRSESGGDLSMASKKTDDSSHDDDSVSIISNENEEVEEESEQIQYSILDKNLFGIRRRRTKLVDKCKQTGDIELAKDALEDVHIESMETIPYDCSDRKLPKINKFNYAIFTLLGITGCYLSFKYIPMYINTFIIGGFITFKFRHAVEMFFTEKHKEKLLIHDINYIPDNEASIIRSLKSLYDLNPQLILYKGWMNQFFYDYRPETYRLSLTVSVYVRLKGSVLIMSYPYYKVPKRSLYNEIKPKLLFVKECMYKLSRCNITLLPQNLVNKRKWSKKYPICIELNSESLIGVRRSLKSKKFIQETDEWLCKDNITQSSKAEFHYENMLECGISDMKDDYDITDQSNPENKKNSKVDVTQTDIKSERKINESDGCTSKNSEKLINLKDENEIDSILKTDSDKIYLFARNDPEKELWFHRLNLATSFDMMADDELVNKKKENVEEYNKFIKAYLVYIYNIYNSYNYPILTNNQKKKEKISQSNRNSDDQYLWLNMLLGRICFDYLQNPTVLEMIADKFQRKLNTIRLPKVMDMIVIRSLCFGKGEIPTIRQASKPWLDHRGIWFELEIVYNGTFEASVDTKLNLMKLKKEEAQQQKEDVKTAFYDSNQEDSGETSNDEGQTREDVNFAERLFEQQSLNEPPPPQGSRITRFMENCSSGFLELKFVRKVFENVAKKELTLVINMKQLVGTLIINLPPPPTDRIWVSFKDCPQINFEAKPKVNDTKVPLMDVLTKVLHNLLMKEFEKVFVLPNMVDFALPMMNNEY